MNGTAESHAGATGESLLNLITQLYEGSSQQLGLTQVAELVGLGSTVRRPRRKVRCVRAWGKFSVQARATCVP